MRFHSAGAFALALGLLVALPLVGSAANPPADPQPTTVILRGPFGTVAGTDPATPAVAAPDDRALDTWMREVPLEVAVSPPLDESATLTLTSTISSGDPAELPIEDGRWVTGPEQAGEHVVVATVEQDGQEPIEQAWLLFVPDRPGNIETLWQMPAVEAHVRAASGSVTGDRGHGCYVDMCQEVGYRPPTASLEPLAVEVGEPLVLELDDGSAVVHWEGRLEPRPGTVSETRLAQATYDDPVSGPTLTGLEADAAGEWLLELRADYDRQRGWQWYLFRLVAE